MGIWDVIGTAAPNDGATKASSRASDERCMVGVGSVEWLSG
jgi:hypothetical protein